MLTSGHSLSNDTEHFDLAFPDDETDQRPSDAILDPTFLKDEYENETVFHYLVGSKSASLFVTTTQLQREDPSLSIGPVTNFI